MRISAVAFFMILTTVFLSGCGSSNMASVDDRGTNYYGRSGVMALGSVSAPLPTNGSYRAASQQMSAATSTVSSRDLPPPSTTTQIVPLRMSSWQWPVQGTVTETFGRKANGVASEGIVIAAAEGTPIHAAQSGEVAFVGKDTKNYGNIVILRHADGNMTSYSHARDIVVKKGERVDAGGVLGYVGKSGSAKAPQLHFAVREAGTSIDPMSKLPHQMASN